MKKKIALPLVLAAGLLGLAACGSPEEGGSGASSGGDAITVDWGTTTQSYAEASKKILDAGNITIGTQNIKIWCAENATVITEAQVNEFKGALDAAGVDVTGLTFTVEAQGEGDAASAMITDVEAGADIFCFAQDQLTRLIGANALSPLNAVFARTVEANNDAASLTAISKTNENGLKSYYAYPLTSDNGYFMYYDKSVITDDVNLDDLGAIVQACKDAGKTFDYDYSSAWYNMGVWYANGCHSEWTTDNSGGFVSYDDTYNTDAGAVAWKAFYDETWGIDADTISSNYVVSKGFGAKAAVVVSGTWDYKDAVTALGDNLGATDLPSFTINGEEHHLNSFSGNKLMGVKPQTDTSKAYISYLIANYLSGYVGQMGRFNELGWGPSNLTAQADSNVTNPALEALALQGAYATPQGNYPGGWWDLAKAVGPDVKNSGGDLDTIKTVLSNYASGLDSLITKAIDWSSSTVSIIGDVAASENWTKDLDMTPNDGHTVFSYEGLECAVNDEWKIRLDHNWNTSWGSKNVVTDDNTSTYADLSGDNIKMLAAGTYDITFSTDTYGITITPQTAA